jgi:hypothetical protein
VREPSRCALLFGLITLADVPEKKTNLVAGSYRVPAGGKAVAVKITDMLGEEVLVEERTAVA